MLTKQMKTATCTSSSTLKDTCITTLIMVFALLSALLLQTHSASAISISTNIPLRGYCDNPSPHCYAEVTWNGDVGGAGTELDPYGSITCPGCHVGAISNEMWLTDTSTPACVNDEYGACWVESGIATWEANRDHSCNPGLASTCIFWADSRPNGGGYTEWTLYNVGPDGTDLSPFYFWISISNLNSSSATGSAWQVVDSVYKNNTWQGNFSGTSTENQMTVGAITIGSEVSNGSASASPNYFNYNDYLYPPTNTWRYQPITGQNTSTDSPPSGQWATYPCNCTGNTGGSWETYD